MKFLLSIVSILLIVCSLQSKTIKKSNSSEIELFVDKYEYEVTNTSYKVVSYYPEGKSRRMLIEETINKKQHIYKDGIESYISLKAYDCFMSDSLRPLWKINDSGETNLIENNMVTLISNGCCSTQPTYIYFDLETGEHLMHTSQPINLLRSRISTQSWIVGFFHHEAIIWDSTYVRDTDLLGIIHFINKNKMKFNLLIYTEKENLEIFPKMELFDSIDPNPKNKSTEIENIIFVHIELNDNSKIIIPISKVGFVIDKIMAPKYIRIEIEN